MNENFVRDISRRTFLGRGAAGLGVVALNSLLGPRLFADAQAPAVQSRGVVNPLHFPPKAKRVIFLYQAGGPSHLETFDYKPKLAEMHGQADAGVVHQGPADRAAAGPAADLLRAAARLQEVRQVRPGDLRAVPAHRQRRRRHLHHPLDVDRADQSRSGAHVHEHRLDHHGPAEHGLVAAVRPGRGDGGSARASSCSSRRARAARCSRSPRASGRPASCRASSRA